MNRSFNVKKRSKLVRTAPHFAVVDAYPSSITTIRSIRYESLLFCVLQDIHIGLTQP